MFIMRGRERERERTKHAGDNYLAEIGATGALMPKDGRKEAVVSPHFRPLEADAGGQAPSRSCARVMIIARSAKRISSSHRANPRLNRAPPLAIARPRAILSISRPYEPANDSSRIVFTIILIEIIAISNVIFAIYAIYGS